MNEFKIALIPGDGIGPEIVYEAVKVMNQAAGVCGISLAFEEYKAGGCAIDEFGVPLPDETLEGARKADAVLLGAVGGPKWDGIDPKLRPERALLGLRSGLGLYANLRPAVMYDALAASSPLKNVSSMDIMIVRELTGGIYFGESGIREDASNGRTGYDTESYSELEIRRILRTGFEVAMGRKKHLTLVDKANVLTTSRMWREIAGEMSRDYPEVALDYMYVDNCAMQLIGKPGFFDVIVTSNMFGDILSDEAGEITGSIGLLPSASLGEPGKPGMFEPVHGSAPDIAGMGIANPIATILSAAMLMRLSLGQERCAKLIEDAVARVISKGYRTPDIADGSTPDDFYVGTARMGDLVYSEIAKGEER